MLQELRLDACMHKSADDETVLAQSCLIHAHMEDGSVQSAVSRGKSSVADCAAV